MEPSGLPYLPVSKLSGLIESKEVSPVEVTQAYLERIESVDAKLNSYITVCGEEALNAARQAEGAILKGSYLGPMHGIPMSVKDQIYTKGIRTTAGSTILWDFFPEEDATVVTNLKKAGAVLLGKLNLSEFAKGDSFYHPAGTPRNPWNLDHNPGISSSGSAAATAAFLCATSLGEGYRRLHANPRGLLRARGSEAYMGESQPLWSAAGELVYGRRGTHLPHHGGLRHHPECHSRARPQGPLYLEDLRARLPRRA